MNTVQERDKDIAQGSYGVRRAKNAFKAAAARLQLGVSRAMHSRAATEAQADAAAWARVQVSLVQLLPTSALLAPLCAKDPASKLAAVRRMPCCAPAAVMQTATPRKPTRQPTMRCRRTGSRTAAHRRRSSPCCARCSMWTWCCLATPRLRSDAQLQRQPPLARCLLEGLPAA